MPNRGLIKFRPTALVQLEGLPVFEQHHFLVFQRDVLLHGRDAGNRSNGGEPEKKKSDKTMVVVLNLMISEVMVVRPRLAQ
jgi:hypothetical protein